MTFYSVLAVTPTAEGWVVDYVEPATALVAQHGGKYLARTASHERLEGEGAGRHIPFGRRAANFLSQDARTF